MKTWSPVIPARIISAVLMQPHGDGVETPSLLSRLLYCAVNHYSGRGGHVQQFTTQSWQASTRLAASAQENKMCILWSSSPLSEVSKGCSCGQAQQ